MSLYSRLGLNFDTTRFGSGETLSIPAANTLTLIANTSGTIPTWQQYDLSVGSPVPSNYFRNPTSIYLNQLQTASNTLLYSANTANTANISLAAADLILELASFQSHTDNISGVVQVNNNQFPSFQSAQNLGQLNMMTLAKSDGVSNTAPILGSYTSLFIQDELSANANTLIFFVNEVANSINNMSQSSNLSNIIVANITSYIQNTQSLLATRRTGDWTFYQNSTQLARDVGYMQQFNSLGGTASYLISNLVGTQALTANLGTILTTAGGGATGSVPGQSGVSSYSNAPITSLGTVVTGIWQASVIQPLYGGTGLASFGSGGALYATSANNLTVGILPLSAGGTGTTSSTGSGSVVLNTAPTLINAILNGTTTIPNVSATSIVTTNVSATSIVTTNLLVANVSATSLSVTNVVSNITTTNVIPSITSTYSLGSANNRWANIYTSDLQLSNESKGPNDVDGTTGNWTIQEGSNDLFIINNKTGKRYKFSLEEV